MPVYDNSDSTTWRRHISRNTQVGPVAPTNQQNVALDPVPAGHLTDPPVGPLGPLGPLAAKGITWNDVVVAKPNPVSVRIQRPGQVIQLLVPITIYVSDQWTVPKRKPTKKSVRRQTKRQAKRPVRGK